MEQLNEIITKIDDFVWGPVMLILLVGTGVFLTFRTRFLTWRNLLTGSDITIAAFETILGSAGGWLVTIGITLFAFSTILGWEYHGEKAFEYLLGTHKYNMIYRVVFSLVVYFGCTQTLSLVWNFSDIANALMAIPNLICMLLLSGEIAKDIKEFQSEIKK